MTESVVKTHPMLGHACVPAKFGSGKLSFGRHFITRDYVTSLHLTFSYQARLTYFQISYFQSHVVLGVCVGHILLFGTKSLLKSLTLTVSFVFSVCILIMSLLSLSCTSQRQHLEHDCCSGSYLEVLIVQIQFSSEPLSKIFVVLLGSLSRTPS